MQINEHIIKISGTANVPEPLEMGSDYSVKIDGTITSIIQTDNDDGTINVNYKLKPILVTELKGKGKNIQTKDKSSASKRLRNRAWIYQQDTGDDKRGYEWFTQQCINRYDEVVDFLTTLENQ